VRYRIAAAQISHETNVFSSVRTDTAAFERSGIAYGEDILHRELGTNSAFGGFLTAADELDFDLIPIVSVWATPSGIVTAEALRSLLLTLENGLRDAGPIDGVLLGLHGAMVSELDDDADAFILEAVRAIVGPETPVVATLDLHANISPRMVDAATTLIGYDTYPHVDMAERAGEAASLLMRILRGEARPVSALVKPPMMPTSQNMVTDRDPMRSLIARAQVMERDRRVLNVTVAGGFPPAAVVETGFSILVTTDGDPTVATQFANELALEAWSLRDGFLGGVTTFDEAAAVVSALPDDVARPIVLVDIGDNPWSGSPGDSAELLRFLLKQRVARAALAMVVDPESVARCNAAGVGSRVELQLGGKTDDLHGPPLVVEGNVRLMSDGCYVNNGPMMAGLQVDLGPTVVFICGDPKIEVLITSKAETPIDLNIFRAHGIEPTERRVIALKGKGHFRAAFEPIAERVILVEGPGISGADLSRLPFRKIRRPIWPLDEGTVFE
jgi:microcystin degradation protein MlrC